MNTEETNRTLSHAITEYGIDAQTKMAVEEMSELTKELCKSWRGKDNADHIAEEIADVEIMLAQLKMIYGIAGKVAWYREAKLNRLRERLEGNA